MPLMGFLASRDGDLYDVCSKSLEENLKSKIHGISKLKLRRRYLKSSRKIGCERD